MCQNSLGGCVRRLKRKPSNEENLSVFCIFVFTDKISQLLLFNPQLCKMLLINHSRLLNSAEFAFKLHIVFFIMYRLLLDI